MIRTKSLPADSGRAMIRCPHLDKERAFYFVESLSSRCYVLAAWCNGVAVTVT
jgi:hypothetical protein